MSIIWKVLKQLDLIDSKILLKLIASKLETFPDYEVLNKNLAEDFCCLIFNTALESNNSQNIAGIGDLKNHQHSYLRQI